MSWKIESFSSDMLKRQSSRSSKYQVHSVRAHITVSSVHTDGRKMLRNFSSALTEHSICFYKRWTFFPFYIIIKTILLRKCFEYAQAITGDWIYFEVVWIVNHRNKFLTRLPSCIIFVIFLDIRLEACSFTKNKPLIRYFLSILTTVSPGNFKSCYF